MLEEWTVGFVFLEINVNRRDQHLELRLPYSQLKLLAAFMGQYGRNLDSERRGD